MKKTRQQLLQPVAEGLKGQVPGKRGMEAGEVKEWKVGGTVICSFCCLGDIGGHRRVFQLFLPAHSLLRAAGLAVFRATNKHRVRALDRIALKSPRGTYHTIGIGAHSCRV